jgi:hypothetical protein
VSTLFTLVNQTTQRPTGSISPITSASFISASGDLLVAAFVTFASHTLTAPITDSKGNTWQKAIGPIGTTQGFGWVYYAENITGGSGHTVTLTLPIGDFTILQIFEISGAALSSSLSNTNSSSASGTTHSSGNITSNSSVPEVFVGIGALSKTAEASPGFSAYGWIPPNGVAADSTHEGFIAGTKFVKQSTTDQFSFTTSSANNECCIIVGFKAASSSGGGISEVSHAFIGF